MSTVLQCITTQNTQGLQNLTNYCYLIILAARNADMKEFTYQNYSSELYIFFLWLYSRILGLGRLHETFRFISVTRSRTVSRTPWTGDQLVARPLMSAPGDCEDEDVGGMNDFWQGRPKYSQKTCLDATLSTTNPTFQTRARTRAAAVGSQRRTASAMARPLQ
jgi:hypothetical protein